MATAYKVFEDEYSLELHDMMDNKASAPRRARTPKLKPISWFERFRRRYLAPPYQTVCLFLSELLWGEREDLCSEEEHERAVDQVLSTLLSYGLGSEFRFDRTRLREMVKQRDEVMKGISLGDREEMAGWLMERRVAEEVPEVCRTFLREAPLRGLEISAASSFMCLLLEETFDRVVGA